MYMSRKMAVPSIAVMSSECRASRRAAIARLE
jgi:hypothetical protein